MSYKIDLFEDVKLTGEEGFDLMLFAITGETRGWSVPEMFRNSPSPAWALVRRNEHLVGKGLEREIEVRLPNVSAISGESFEEQLLGFLSNASGPVRILLDVSCMTRSDMGRVFGRLLKPSGNHDAISLTIAYIIADFSDPPEELSLNEFIQPIAPEFAGWPDNASSSTSLIVGLGYEAEKADGACEYFDASENWVFFPESPIAEFDEVVAKNNRLVIERAERQRKLIRYPVDCPSEALVRLATLVADQGSDANPVILPFGPKIFVAISLIVAAVNPEVGVWHATGDTDLSPADHEPSEHLIALNVSFVCESDKRDRLG